MLTWACILLHFVPVFLSVCLHSVYTSAVTCVPRVGYKTTTHLDSRAVGECASPSCEVMERTKYGPGHAHLPKSTYEPYIILPSSSSFMPSCNFLSSHDTIRLEQ